jgi:hypothetical protein
LACSFSFFVVDEDIIDKDDYEFVEHHHKHGVHEVHEVGWGISDTKGDEDITNSNMTMLMACEQNVNQSYIMVIVFTFDE